MKKIINIFFSGELNKEEKPRNHYEKSNPDLRILRSFALSLRSRKLSGEQGHCKVHVWPASWKLTTTNTNVDNVEWVSEWSQKRMINYELSRCHSKCHITFNLSSQKTLLLKRRDMFYLSFTFVITEVFAFNLRLSVTAYLSLLCFKIFTYLGSFLSLINMEIVSLT